MVRKIGKYLILALVLIGTKTAYSQENSLTAKCSRTTVGLKEQFRVTFTTDKRGSTIVPPGMDDFLIVGGPFQSQQTQIINGNFSFQKEISYQLVPKKEGNFTIGPALMISRKDTIRSNTLTINVKAGTVRENSLTAEVKDDFYTRILTSKKEVYVGEPFVMLFRAYWTKPIRNLGIVQSPNFEGVLQNQLSLEQQEKREIINGKPVQYLDFDKKLLTATQPGTLQGEDLQLSAQIQVPTGRRDFFNMPEVTYVNQVVSGEIPQVIIKPLPSPKPSSFSGAVGELTFTRTLSRHSVNGDESISVKIKIAGSGNFNTIAVPELIPPEGFDVYDPKFNEKVTYSSSGVKGYKELEYLLVPKFKGEFIIPEMRWTYFNTKTGTYQEIVLEEDKVEVLSGPNAPLESGETGIPNKREVNDIDNDIRYLHANDEIRSTKDWHGLVIILVSIVALLWLIQAVKLGSKPMSDHQIKKREKAIVIKAFEQQTTDRYGILFNILEERLVAIGIDKEQISLNTFEKQFGKAESRQLQQLLERCQMAEYAPGTVGDDRWFIEEFKSVWEWI